jgi:SAM-dependent methyltransferase
MFGPFSRAVRRNSLFRPDRARNLELEGFALLDACFACGNSHLEEVGAFRYPSDQAGFVPERWTAAWLGVDGLLVRCAACGSQGPRWRPGDALLAEWYAAQGYTSEDATSNGHLAAIAAQRDGVFGEASELVDVGTGSGAFLDRVLAPIRATGLEPSRVGVEAATARGRRVVMPDASGWSRELPDRVDVITLFDVVEHLPRPGEMLAGLTTHLKRPGCLVVFTGDAGSPWAQLYGARWWYHSWAGHVSCFSAQGLVELVEHLGGRCVHQKLMAYVEPPLGVRSRIRSQMRDTVSNLLNRSGAATVKDRFVTPYAGSPLGQDHVLVIAEFN